MPISCPSCWGALWDTAGWPGQMCCWWCCQVPAPGTQLGTGLLAETSFQRMSCSNIPFLSTGQKWGIESLGDLTEILKEVCVRVRAGASSPFVIQVEDGLWKLPLSPPDYLFVSWKGAGCASSLGVLGKKCHPQGNTRRPRLDHNLPISSDCLISCLVCAAAESNMTVICIVQAYLH